MNIQKELVRIGQNGEYRTPISDRITLRSFGIEYDYLTAFYMINCQTDVFVHARAETRVTFPINVYRQHTRFREPSSVVLIELLII